MDYGKAGVRITDVCRTAQQMNVSTLYGTAERIKQSPGFPYTRPFLDEPTSGVMTLDVVQWGNGVVRWAGFSADTCSR